MTRPAPLIVLTGPSGSGKTTLCGRLVGLARSAGLEVAGVFSPARMADGRKVGIEARDPRSGESRLLAWPRVDGQRSALQMGPWSFDESVIAWGDSLLKAATPCDLLVVDELGRLELVRHRGWNAGLDAVASRAYQQALVVVRSELLPLAPSRWPEALVIDVSGDAQRRSLRSHLLPALAEGYASRG